MFQKIVLRKLVEIRTEDLEYSKALLEEAVEAKDKLFSIIAHDLKNPLQPLVGLLPIIIIGV